MAGKLLVDYIHTGHRGPVLTEADMARCATVAAEAWLAPAPAGSGFCMGSEGLCRALILPSRRGCRGRERVWE